MKLDFKEIVAKLKKVWENKFDQVVISFILLLTLALAILGGFIVYQNLIKTEVTEEEQLVPRRELKIKTELLDKALGDLEKRKKIPSLDEVEKTPNPFPEA